MSIRLVAYQIMRQMYFTSICHSSTVPPALSVEEYALIKVKVNLTRCMPSRQTAEKGGRNIADPGARMQWVDSVTPRPL
jgi:hypothetical protein